MQRFKNFVSTGLATNGRLYAGDLNLMQDLAAAQSDFGQTHDVATLRVGDGSLQLTKFGTAEGRFTGALRADGIVRGLSGLLAGTYTTAQRDAIPAGGAPYGVVILNTTTNQYEWNKGTDTSRSWSPLGVDPIGNLNFSGGASAINFTGQNAGNYPITMKRGSDSQSRAVIREDGAIEWGPGGAGARDTNFYRNAAGSLATDGRLFISGLSRKMTYGGGFPGGALHGDEHNIGIGDGSFWKFNYDAGIGDPYKWRFTGGPPLEHRAWGTASVPGAGTWYPMGDGPFIDLPFSGVWRIFTAVHTWNTASTNRTVLAWNGNLFGDQLGGDMPYVITITVAASRIQHYYWTDIFRNAPQWDQRHIMVWPVRVA